uniref:Uncharacterized protein n=1 Tax=viral metagenome TaxID=1070528 RepID=A0A6C0H9H9_9ZZZZ
MYNIEILYKTNNIIYICLLLSTRISITLLKIKLYIISYDKFLIIKLFFIIVIFRKL